MYKMHVTDIFVAFYIHKKITLANIVKIKRLRIKDGLQYMFEIHDLSKFLILRQ